MSDLDDAMQKRMFDLVVNEGKNFCYLDFLDLMKPKTYRNKICKLKKEGIVEDDYKTSVAYHTLTGHTFGKSGTRNHTAVTVSHNHPMYKILEGLVLGKASFHNVHLTFTLPKVYNLFSNTDLPRIKRSKQIMIPWWKKCNVIVRCIISKTDTISVTVACSSQPFVLDFKGFNQFSSVLGNIEGRLQNNLDNLLIKNPDNIDQIPDSDRWLITEWHLNTDGLQEYTGKGFSITWESAKHIIYRIYANQLGKHKHIRMERQNSPRNTVEELEDLIEDRLNFPS